HYIPLVPSPRPSRTLPYTTLFRSRAPPRVSLFQIEPAGGTSARPVQERRRPVPYLAPKPHEKAGPPHFMFGIDRDPQRFPPADGDHVLSHRGPRLHRPREPLPHHDLRRHLPGLAPGHQEAQRVPQAHRPPLGLSRPDLEPPHPFRGQRHRDEPL